MTTPVSNKVIAITGGASGIGLATAHLLASRGAHLSLADLNADALSAAQSAITSAHPAAKVLTTRVDVRDAAQVDAWIAATVQELGALHGAVNLAGVIPPGIGKQSTAEIDDAEWAFVIGVNLTGVMHSLRAELRHLADGGSIVNASSVAGVSGRPFNAPYSASKHGVVGLTQAAAKEFGKRGIRVNAICPGYTETPMTALSDTLHEKAGASEGRNNALLKDVPLGRPGQPEEIAALIAFLLGDESKFITGTSSVIDGGLEA